MATEEADFHLRVRRKFSEKLIKEVGSGENDLLQPMGYRGPPESRYSVSNFLWIVAAITTFYYTDFVNTVLYDTRTKATWLNIGLALVMVNCSICLFLVVWMSHIRKVASDDWDKHYPSAIPIAAASFVFGGFFMMVGLWPVWNLFTPFILFTLLMGVIVVIAMLPNWV